MIYCRYKQSEIITLTCRIEKKYLSTGITFFIEKKTIKIYEMDELSYGRTISIIYKLFFSSFC